MYVVVQRFGEGVGQAGEAAVLHPDRQVRPLNERRGNVRRVRVALDNCRLHPGADRRAMAATRRLRIGLVDFRDGHVIRIRSERLFNGPQMGVVAVRGDLDAVAGDAGAKVVSEDQGAFARNGRRRSS